ncbi:MAG: hypothetical protein U0Q22_03210 [Acidimicrobiales bacterium]
MTDPLRTTGTCRTRRARALGGQAGNSLIEVLLAVILVSVVLLGIIAGFQTTAKVASDAGERSALQTALATATDRVSTLAFPGCASVPQLNTVATAANIAPSGYTATITGVSYLVPAGACNAATTSALMLSVSVRRSPAAGPTITGQVVLRNRAARPT